MKALIIGGGIAGTATALALHKAGIQCEVFEARESSSDGVGAFVTLAANGVSTLRMLGLDVSRIPGIDTTRMRLMLGDGVPLVDFPLGPESLAPLGSEPGAPLGPKPVAPLGPESRVPVGPEPVAPPGALSVAAEVGAPQVHNVPGADTQLASAGDDERVVTRTVKRAELYGALRRRVEELGIHISYGKRLVGTSTSAGGVVMAQFDDGTEAMGDLLVGADGLHSRVRTLIDAKASPPRYLGVLNAGGYVHGDGDARRWGDAGVMQMMFGAKTLFSWLDDGQGGVWWFANPPLAREPQRGQLRQLGGAEWRARLLQLVEGDSGPATTIIRSTDELFEPWPTHDLPKVKTWSRDRCLIVGDAAHAASPSSGQGASMAIEDAAVLALALRDSASIEQAFALYERVRRPRVSRIVAQGKRNGDGKTPGRLGRAVRDFFLRRVLTKPPRPDALRWLYEYPLDWQRGL